MPVGSNVVGVAYGNAAAPRQTTSLQIVDRRFQLFLIVEKVGLGTAVPVFAANEDRILWRTLAAFDSRCREVVYSSPIESHEQRESLKGAQGMVEDQRVRQGPLEDRCKTCRAFQFVAGQPIEVGEDVVTGRPGTFKEQLLIGQRNDDVPK